MARRQRISRNIPYYIKPSGGLFTEPGNQAAVQFQTVASNDPDRSIYQRLSVTPVAMWVPGYPATASTVTDYVSSRAAAAVAAGQTPIFHVYNIPLRDVTGGYSAGGAPDEATYRAHIDAIRLGLANRPAIVILEADALAQFGSLTTGQQAERVACLQYATTIANSNVSVYLDAGNARWQPAATMASRIKQMDPAERLAGFSLNVSNFITTAESVAYGDAIRTALGRPGARYLVDASRNGNGPWTDPDDPTPWCNPPGRALGADPRLFDSGPLAGLVWVKTPWRSDGACRTGAPGAGVPWWANAVSMARAAGWS